MSTVLTTTITEHLYHPLYTLWLPCRPGNLLSLASPENYEQADKVLQESPGFQAYLHHVETSTANPSPLLLVFAIPRLSQLIILRQGTSLDNKPSTSVIFQDSRLYYPEMSGLVTGSTRDEDLVRLALSQLLDGLGSLVLGDMLKWRDEEYPFKPTLFGNEVMEARVDGALTNSLTNEAFAILDARTVCRIRERRKLYWEETAKMISWIQHDLRGNRQHPPPRYLIVSQYLEQIYIVVANFDKDYEVYIKILEAPVMSDNPRLSCEMMEMSEFGPFNIDDAAHMKEFARHIVAYYCEVQKWAFAEVPN